YYHLQLVRLYIYDILPHLVETLKTLYEDDHPGISYSLMRGFEKVRDVLPDSREDIKECEVCGEPSSGNICKMCEFRSRCRVHQFMS
ncbi:MAG: hypothetical protein ACXQTA_03520, partial [Candidatus Syntropharchaeales archaeon]